MNDTISRQQTITALRALSDENGYINAPHEVVTDVVRGLPPVQAEHGQTTQPERGETDKLASKMRKTWVDVTCPNCGCEIHVESEIVRCKDCKFRDEGYRRTTVKWLPCMEMMTGGNWFCGSAERREDG